MRPLMVGRICGGAPSCGAARLSLLCLAWLGLVWSVSSAVRGSRYRSVRAGRAGGGGLLAVGWGPVAGASGCGGAVPGDVGVGAGGFARVFLCRGPGRVGGWGWEGLGRGEDR
ncbi:hypothetical protein GCM10010317_104470 [Streptomyces mirabilis]|nr:hypothetical protein GCM10010317_104470 [Streptomyces mirabilis]